MERRYYGAVIRAEDYSSQLEELLQARGFTLGRKGRGRCAFTDCENRTGFSFQKDKGRWRCFACNRHGDIVDLYRQFDGMSFVDALKAIGIEGGKPPEPDAQEIKRMVIRDGLRNLYRSRTRKIRNRYRHRQSIQNQVRERLQTDPEDSVAWEMLRIASDGECKDELLLEELEGAKTDEQLRSVSREYEEEL
jgi:hypothetical protein